jgi:hypothetical protein
MLIYPHKATTVKTIDSFTYNMYLDIFINTLKYNNDSSSALRFLGAAIDTSQDILEDLVYKPRFNIREIDFLTIDRFNGFRLDNIPNVILTKDQTDTICNNSLIGFSEFTQSEYILKEIPNNTDFVRHSFPCDCFFEKLVTIGEKESFVLYPNIRTTIDKTVNKSSITIRPYSGLNSISMISNTVTITIEGFGLTGERIKEDISINSYIDYKSKGQFTSIETIRMIGSMSSVSIFVFPYINGEYEKWDNDIIEREMFEIFPTFMTVDMPNKNLIFNIVKDNKTEFPIHNEQFKIVPLSIGGEEDINSYFIDRSNKLLYITTSIARLYCFPLIIPIKYSNKLDSLKTFYQSVNIEYNDDCIAKEYSFYIFPSSKTNDIESMSIFINGEEYQSDLLLDLYRSNIETNRIVIPYRDIFIDTDEAIIEFKTYGLDYCNCPIYVCNPTLEHLYIKDLTTIPVFGQPENASSFSTSYITSRNTNYLQTLTGDIGINDFTLTKLSTKANILLNGYEIINIFDTFNYDEFTNTIITSDTITNIRSDNFDFLADEIGEQLVDEDNNSFVII